MKEREGKQNAEKKKEDDSGMDDDNEEDVMLWSRFDDSDWP
jgi:hypothetical protein